MLKTDLTQFENDLNEVVRQFDGGENLEIVMNCALAEKAKDNFSVSVNIENSCYDYVYTLSCCNALEEKRYKKRYLKSSLYQALSAYFGVELPWGALTGIRPTKLAYQSLSERGEFHDYFTKNMFVSEKKTKLISDILNAQSDYIEHNDDNCDLFLGIPFCPSRCSYCSFVSNVISKEKLLKDYVGALIKETLASKRLIKNLRSVYIGGGTPVALENEDFCRILQAVGNPQTEYTVEAGRPDCITEEKLEIMKSYGVTRVCVNPQTFCNETLKRLNRLHTAEDIFDKYALTKRYGFDVNMDLIAGLSGEDFATFKNSVDTAISLRPENITIHTLSLKHGSKLKESCERLIVADIEKMVDYAHETLYKAGYNPYYLYRQKYMAGNLENTGYALKGKECVYNIDIMEETAQIIANGANAVSKSVENDLNKIERCGAPKDIKTYIEKVDSIIGAKKALFGR
ncbi:MAG: coproporphyrinogen dehydrogenase HemZ [Christensenellaceae bacterium]